MPNKPDNLRAQLLAQGEPTRDKLTLYKQETQTMLQDLDRSLRRQKWFIGAMWIYAVIFMTAALLLLGYLEKTTPDILILSMGFLLTINGAIYIITHCVNVNRVELLKELKGLEAQVLELKERLGK